MKIFVAGTRGIPDIPGGVEKHCQELYPRVVEKGHEVLLCTRSPYVKKRNDIYKGVKLLYIFCPRIKSLEAIFHTFACLIAAIQYQPDILHIHGIGPALMVPLARLMGFKVVMTHHGPDYDRQKWGRFAKWVLKLGEYWGARLANEVIVISKVIKTIIHDRCNRSSHLIYNGVPQPKNSISKDYLDQIGVSLRNYILAVARFVPEKGLHDLIHAFNGLEGPLKMVIAGDADHETEYSQNIKNIAKENNQIVLTGYITGEPLNQLFSHARLFLLPSYHEGLPISLLEALSYGLPSLVSDIPANKEVGLDSKYYFSCGNVDDLKAKLNTLLENDFDSKGQRKFQEMVAEKYNWDKIAKQTIDIYRKALKGKAEKRLSVNG